MSDRNLAKPIVSKKANVLLVTAIIAIALIVLFSSVYFVSAEEFLINETIEEFPSDITEDMSADIPEDIIIELNDSTQNDSLQNDFLQNYTDILIPFNDSITEDIPENITIEIVNSDGESIDAEVSIVDNATDNENPDVIVEIQDVDIPVESIEFQDVNVTTSADATLGIDNVPETIGPEGQIIEETYAIDPTALDFTEATVTVTASPEATALYKCASWNFEQQTCTDGDWTFVQSITPGEPYEITLTPNDPAYSETQQPATTTGKDSWILSNSPDQNNGADDTLKVKDVSGTNRALLQFNLSSIPSNAAITNANVTLYREAGTDNGEENISIYRVTRAWDEGTGVAQKTDNGATWANATNTTTWTTSGGDYVATEFARTAVGANGYYTWNITSLVQGWVNGTWSNYGMIFVVSTAGDDLNTFTSSDDTITAQRPQFNVSYTTALNISLVSPTPANASTVNQSWVYVNASLTNGPATEAKLEWAGTNYTMSGSGTNWYYNKTGLTNGIYLFKVYANDSATKVFDVSETRTVTVNANVAPQVSLNLPGNNTQYNNTQSINFNFTATDDYNTTFSCSVYLDGILNQTNSSTANNTLANFLITGISYGSHYWHINCTDGELSAVSTANYFSIINSLPSAINLVLNSTDYPNNKTDGTLQASWAFSDADVGDTQQGYSIKWYKDDAEQAALENSTIVDSGNTSKNEVWKFSISVTDGRNWSSWANSSTLTIQNSLPTAPIVDVLPNAPGDNDDLVATIATASADADNDTISYAYQWYKNDTLQVGQTSNTLSNILTNLGDSWKCIATPNDGTGNGATAYDNVTITSVPDITPAVITISSPANGSQLSAGTTSAVIEITTNEYAICSYNLTNSTFDFVDGINITDVNSITHNFTLSGLTDGTAYVLYYKCNDTAGNINNVSTMHSFSIASPSSGGNNGGGGGGGGGGAGGITASEQCSLDNPVDLTLSFGEAYACLYYGTAHSIRLSGIINNVTELTIASEPVKAQFNTGETKLFDLDGDGVSDLEVTVLSQNDTSVNVRATFFGKVVTEVPTTTTQLPEATETETEEMPELVPSGLSGAAVQVKPYKAPNPLYAVPTLLLLVLVFAIAVMRKEKLPPRMKKALTGLHIALIVIIVILLIFTFVKTPLTGATVAVNALQVNIPASRLVLGAAVFIASIAVTVLSMLFHHKNHSGKKIKL